MIVSLMLPLPTTPILTPGQIERIANILDNAGQVILGVVVVTPLVSGFDKVGISVVALGLISVLFCCIISISLACKKDLYTDDI